MAINMNAKISKWYLWINHIMQVARAIIIAIATTITLTTVAGNLQCPSGSIGNIRANIAFIFY
jgi:hypothetical protein